MKRAGICCLAVLWGFLASSATDAEPCLRTSDRQPLAPDLEWVADLRWADAKSVFVAAQRIGVHRVNLSDPSHAELVEPRDSARLGKWLPMILGVSEDYLAVSSRLSAYGWKLRSKKGFDAVQPIEIVSDLDIYANRIAILGAQRGDQGRFAPDGAIAWTGRIDQDSDQLKTVYYSAFGPGARSMDACGLMDLGRVRFLADGSLLIQPGVEPDVHRLSSKGRLLETWTSEAVGFEAECDLSDKQMYKLALDEPGRWAWVNARPTVDEILPLPDAPGLLVRTVVNGTTNWQLKRLHPGGAVDTCAVDLSVDSELAHLRGDVRGDKVVLLLYYDGYTRKTPHPPAHPELLRMRYDPS